VVAWSADDSGCRRVRVWVLDPLGVPVVTPFAGDDLPFIGSGTDCLAHAPAISAGPVGDVALAWLGCDVALVDATTLCPMVRARLFPELLP